MRTNPHETSGSSGPAEGIPELVVYLYLAVLLARVVLWRWFERHVDKEAVIVCIPFDFGHIDSGAEKKRWEFAAKLMAAFSLLTLLGHHAGCRVVNHHILISFRALNGQALWMLMQYPFAVFHAPRGSFVEISYGPDGASSDRIDL